MGRTVNPAIPAIAPEVAAILAIVARSGIVLEPRGDKLRYHPRSAMTQELAARIKANKAELLALLQRNDPLTATDKTPTPQRANSPHGTRSGVLSVLSVSEQGKGLWCEEELGLLAHAEKTPSDLPLAAAVKDSFADVGVTVVSVELAHGQGGVSRSRVARMIREVRGAAPYQAVALRDAWRERLAICTIDGGMSEADAERIALAELEVLDL